MKQVTEKVLKSIITLQNNESFEVFCGWLEDTLRELDKDTRREVDATLLFQKQGRGQILEEILDQIANAKQDLTDLMKRSEQRTLQRRP